MRFKYLLTERATAILYHYTTHDSALSILKDGHFELGSHQESRNPYLKKFPYWMSVARSKDSHIREIKPVRAIFVLDGDWINRHRDCVAGPIDIDSVNRLLSRQTQTSMAEDRIYCRNAKLPWDGLIKELHIFDFTYGEGTDLIVSNIEKAATARNIPWWSYEGSREFLLMDKKRAVDINIVNKHMVNSNMYNQKKIAEGYGASPSTFRDVMTKREMVREAAIRKSRRILTESSDEIHAQMKQQAEVCLAELRYIMEKVELLRDSFPGEQIENTGLFTVHSRTAYKELSDLGKIFQDYENFFLDKS